MPNSNELIIYSDDRNDTEFFYLCRMHDDTDAYLPLLNEHITRQIQGNVASPNQFCLICSLNKLGNSVIRKVALKIFLKGSKEWDLSILSRKLT